MHEVNVLLIFLLFFVTVGPDDDIRVTSSLTTVERFDANDKLFVRVAIPEGHGDSNLISSQSAPSTHFVGMKLSD